MEIQDFSAAQMYSMDYGYERSQLQGIFLTEIAVDNPSEAANLNYRNTAI